MIDKYSERCALLGNDVAGIAKSSDGREPWKRVRDNGFYKLCQNRHCFSWWNSKSPGNQKTSLSFFWLSVKLSALVLLLYMKEVGGREMRVRYSVDMNPGTRRNPEVLNSTPKKILMYESQHKVYVGNLPWFTQPDGLRNHFSKFGTIVSTRVLHDRKTGRNRVFAFLSFTSGEERDAALSFNGTVKFVIHKKNLAWGNFFYCSLALSQSLFCSNMKVAESSSEKVSRRVSRKPTVLLLLQRHLLDTNNV